MERDSQSLQASHKQTKTVVLDENTVILEYGNTRKCQVSTYSLIKSNQIIFIGLRSSKNYYKRPGGGVGIWSIVAIDRIVKRQKVYIG